MGGRVASFGGVVDSTCKTLAYQWKFPDGTTDTSAHPIKAFNDVGPHIVTFEAWCQGCSEPHKTAVVAVTVIEKEIFITTHKAGAAAESSVFDRDEVFDVKVKAPAAFAGDVIIELSSGVKTTTLSYGGTTRSDVQMYDFANYGTNNSLTETATGSHKYKLSFTSADKGQKSFKAIINQEQTGLRIKASIESSGLSAETSPVTINKTVRKYASLSGWTLSTVNNKDNILLTIPQQADWSGTSWKINNFTFPSAISSGDTGGINFSDYDFWKAWAYKENTKMNEKNMWRVATARSVLSGSSLERSVNANATPYSDGGYSYQSALNVFNDIEHMGMALTAYNQEVVDASTKYVTGHTPDDSEVWSAYWAKRWVIRLRWYRDYSAGKYYNLHDRGIHEAFNRYGEDWPNYADPIVMLYILGKNPHINQPNNLWPIKVSGFSR